MKRKEYVFRIEASILADDILFESVIEDCPIVEKFCGKYNTQLRAIVVSIERGRPEPAYEFRDNTGRYLISGLKASLID